MADMGAIGKRTLFANVAGAGATTPSTANVYQRRQHGMVGATTVSGTVTENGSNVARLVRVYDRASGSLLGSTVSNAGTGAFSITISGVNEVFVIAYDNTGTPYNAVIADLVVPA